PKRLPIAPAPAIAIFIDSSSFFFLLYSFENHFTTLFCYSSLIYHVYIHHSSYFISKSIKTGIESQFHRKRN
ncbi:hypothetical protein ABXM71_13720, partial [Enterococcus faecium]|uniref:hypothetical protein n=1 Tax=Enterococcus faecium TaxID=1352 RepID=UPI0033904F07